MKDFSYERHGSDLINSRLCVIENRTLKNKTLENLKTLHSCIDLTSLSNADNENSIADFVMGVNTFKDTNPDIPNVAGICVYPCFVPVVKKILAVPNVKIVSVAGALPHAQTFDEIKIREVELAAEAGADEIDIVLALNAFLAGDYETASNEIKVMKAAIDKAAAAQGRPVVLKVILETGLLVTPEKIADASFLAMEAGADFIKTSTGKVEVNATPTSAYIMCECIKAFYEKTGRKVGFKAAGGISNSKDALCYYCIGKSILGAEWMNKDLFRYGVSRLGNSLMSAIEQKTINFF